MAAGRIIVPPYFPARDRNGDLISGALLYVWANNTTTLATIYADENLTVPAANPAAANASGQFPPVWAEAGTDEEPVFYRVGVTKSTGAAPGNAFIFDDYRPSVDFETAAVALAEAAAAEAEGAYQNVLDAIQAAQDAYGDAAVAGAIAGQAAGEAAAEIVVAGKADIDGSNVEAEAFRGGIGSFATRSAATAHNFAVSNKPSAIRLDGYAAAGDGGGAMYKRVGTEPSHAGKLQSADGQWWELSADSVTPAMFGGDPSGVTDSTAAFRQIESGPFASTVDLAGGTYRITPFSLDSANGVMLTRNYVNGDLIVGGAPLGV